MKDKHVFYAGVHSPRDLRKDVLTSQKSIIDCLKKFEHLHQLRAEKELRITEFRKILSALRIISGQLKTKLPANAIKLAPKQVPVIVEREYAPVVRRQPVQRKPAVHHKTKLEILEDELAKIESKLSLIE